METTWYEVTWQRKDRKTEKEGFAKEFNDRKIALEMAEYMISREANENVRMFKYTTIMEEIEINNW
jgi:hypothetical protein